MLTDHPILIVIAAGVMAPLLTETRAGARVPVIVLEVLLGILIGPHVLGLVTPDPFLKIMSTIGLAAVLFMAGLEVELEQVRGRPLGLAVAAWLGSVALAVGIVALLQLVPGVRAPMMVTLALTTTAVGALLPILRDGGLLETPFGRQVLAAGTVGILAPIVSVSIALSDRHATWQELVFLVVFLAVVVLAALTGLRARHPRLIELLGRTLRASSQLPIRLALLVLATFLALADELGFQSILGAFAAGMVVGLATQGEAGKPFRAKLDAVCFGWFTPFFFIGTGMQFDLAVFRAEPASLLAMPIFLLLLLVVRGVPVLVYRNDLSRAQLAPFAFCMAVASLGLVVVITEIGVGVGSLSPGIAQALIAAAMASLLVYPTLANLVLGRGAKR